MVNKKGLWFLTLFSLILVMSVYYVTMPDELVLKNKDNTETNEENNEVVNLEETDEFSSLRASEDVNLEATMKELQDILTNSESSMEEKNNAYEQMKELNANKGLEESLEKKIKSAHNLESFVKISGNEIQVIINSNKHDKKLANDIMRTVQSEFDTNKYISVKFQA